MKKYLTIAIMGTLGFVFGLVPQTSAQTTSELLNQVFQELAVALQTTGTGSIGTPQQTSVSVAEGNICGLRYNGDDSAIAIQQELQNQGYTITKVDGKVGPETRAAVSSFQANNAAAKVDGIIGNETRKLLAQSSVACQGDANVTITTAAAETTPVTGVCSLGYAGINSAIAIQQELQNQGYTITKVDGKVGPETTAAISAFETDTNLAVTGVNDAGFRTALARASVACNDTNATLLPGNQSISVTVNPTVETNGDVNTSVPVSTSDDTAVVIETTPTSTLVTKTAIEAGVRTTTAGIPDDTAVFTYGLSFTTNNPFYIATNTDAAFDIKIFDASGTSVSTESINSIASSSQKLLRADGTSYFLIKNGDTMSLRSSVQPGAGQYYAELARLSYTNDNAFTVVNPAIINYGLDATQWRSNVVRLLN